MFVDYAKIKVISGHGGDGCVSFRREKYVPKGGPDGGNGGRGGHVFFKVDRQLHTLQDVKYRKQYKAENGMDGSGGRKTGKNGKDIYILVPKGTVFRRNSEEIIVIDLINHGDEFLAAKGGKGGKGNSEFATATRQTPDFAQPGQPGQKFEFIVELKVLADVGLVGLPNAGKSTLLSRLTSAKPKIADYPFTTLQPHLGIVKYKDFTSFVMADIPGLIEGASQGKGLGIRFLKHIERTSILLFLIDSTEENLNEIFNTLWGELNSFNPILLQKPRIVVFTKSDLLSGDMSKLPPQISGNETLTISAITGDGLDNLIHKLYGILNETG